MPPYSPKYGVEAWGSIVSGRPGVRSGCRCIQVHGNDKGTIRFPLSQPVPVKLIEGLAKFRAKDVIAERCLHNETWVKDGYNQIDESAIDFIPLKAIMQIATIRVGHMEINYGDAHFRRTDNGNGS
jgi:hypothetical protein